MEELEIAYCNEDGTVLLLPGGCVDTSLIGLAVL
jgi:hypothetical protein